MEAHYTKITRPDPNSESGQYIDYPLDRNTAFCCDAFKEFCKRFPSWDYQIGRFTIVDSVTYDGNTQIPIGFCPFCGKKIKYKQTRNQKNR
jgi:hypothetical protein